MRTLAHAHLGNRIKRKGVELIKKGYFEDA